MSPFAQGLEGGRGGELPPVGLRPVRTPGLPSLTSAPPKGPPTAVALTLLLVTTISLIVTERRVTCTRWTAERAPIGGGLRGRALWGRVARRRDLRRSTADLRCSGPSAHLLARALS